MSVYCKKPKPPIKTGTLFSQAKREFIENCRVVAINLAKKHKLGLVTIDDVRRATIAELPDYLNTIVYGQIFRPEWAHQYFEKAYMQPVARHMNRNPGQRMVAVWRLK